MLLKDVLGLFDEETNNKIESITFDGSCEDFVLKIVITEDSDIISGDVHLFSDGSSCVDSIECAELDTYEKYGAVLSLEFIEVIHNIMLIWKRTFNE